MRDELFIRKEPRFIDKVTIWGLLIAVFLLLYGLWLASSADYVVNLVNTDLEVCERLGGEISGSGQDMKCSF